MPAGNTGDTGEDCSWGGHPALYSPTVSSGARGPCAVPPSPHLPHPRGLILGGWAMPHPSGSCWAGSRRSAPGEAAATCKDRQRCQAVGAPGGGMEMPLPCTVRGDRGTFLAWPVPSCLHPVGCNWAWGQRALVGHAMPPPEQGDTHADLSTSCRIFFTESLMLKAMLLRMFLK